MQPGDRRGRGVAQRACRPQWFGLFWLYGVVFCTEQRRYDAFVLHFTKALHNRSEDFMESSEKLSLRKLSHPKFEGFDKIVKFLQISCYEHVLFL